MLSLFKAQPKFRIQKNIKNVPKVGKQNYSKSVYQTGFNLLEFNNQKVGELGTTTFRQFLLNKDSSKISYWHQIPLYAGKSYVGDNLVYYVNEIPKGTRAKMELAKDEEYNPIKQDTKNNELRFINYSPVLYNYGFLPQTWENPNVKDTELGLPGDNDPIDVIDIGFKRREIGEVYPVKVLGAIGLIDEGEVDWKVLAISLDDPAIQAIHDVEDIKVHKKGLLESLTDFYKNYKTADGKPSNRFTEKNTYGRDFAFEVIGKTHEEWKKIKSDASLSKNFHFKE